MKHLALKAFYSLILVLMASTAYGQADNEARKDILELRRRVQYLDSKIQDSDQLIYGINTGFGSLCDTAISLENLSLLQKTRLQETL